MIRGYSSSTEYCCTFCSCKSTRMVVALASSEQSVPPRSKMHCSGLARRFQQVSALIHSLGQRYTIELLQAVPPGWYTAATSSTTSSELIRINRAVVSSCMSLKQGGCHRKQTAYRSAGKRQASVSDRPPSHPTKSNNNSSQRTARAVRPLATD